MSDGKAFTQSPEPLDGLPRGRMLYVTPSSFVLQILNLDTNAVVSGTTYDGLVGQKVNLGVMARPIGNASPTPPPGGPLPGGAPGSLTNISWTIPGTTVKSYTRSPKTAAMTPLASNDLTNATIGFYFIDGGSKTVMLQASIDGAQQSASVTINVQRPTVNHFTITTSRVTVGTAFWDSPGSPSMAAWLPAPSPSGTPGCQWDAQVTAPATIGAGRIAITQLINQDRSRTSKTGAVSPSNSSGTFIVDNRYGEEYSGAVDIAAGGSASLNGKNYSDSPSMVLFDTDAAVSANDSFQTYLLYQPAGAGSIWVTLQMATWAWNASANRAGLHLDPTTDWTLASGSVTPPGATSGSDSSSLPQWTDSTSARFPSG